MNENENTNINQSQVKLMNENDFTFGDMNENENITTNINNNTDENNFLNPQNNSIMIKNNSKIIRKSNLKNTLEDCNELLNQLKQKLGFNDGYIDIAELNLEDVRKNCKSFASDMYWYDYLFTVLSWLFFPIAIGKWICTGIPYYTTFNHNLYNKLQETIFYNKSVCSHTAYSKFLIETKNKYILSTLSCSKLENNSFFKIIKNDNNMNNYLLFSKTNQINLPNNTEELRNKYFAFFHVYTKLIMSLVTLNSILLEIHNSLSKNNSNYDELYNKLQIVEKSKNILDFQIKKLYEMVDFNPTNNTIDVSKISLTIFDDKNNVNKRIYSSRNAKYYSISAKNGNGDIITMINTTSDNIFYEEKQFLPFIQTVIKKENEYKVYGVTEEDQGNNIFLTGNYDSSAVSEQVNIGDKFLGFDLKVYDLKSVEIAKMAEKQKNFLRDVIENLNDMNNDINYMLHIQYANRNMQTVTTKNINDILILQTQKSKIQNCISSYIESLKSENEKNTFLDKIKGCVCGYSAVTGNVNFQPIQLYNKQYLLAREKPFCINTKNKLCEPYEFPFKLQNYDKYEKLDIADLTNKKILQYR